MVKKICKQGWGCGSTCISRTKKCRSEMGSDGKVMVENFAQYIARVRPEGGAGGAIRRGDKEDPTKMTQAQRLLESLKNRPEKNPIREEDPPKEQESSPKVKGVGVKKTFKEVPDKFESEGGEIVRVTSDDDKGSPVAMYLVGENSIAASASIEENLRGASISRKEAMIKREGGNIESILKEAGKTLEDVGDVYTFAFTVNNRLDSKPLESVEGLSERELAVRVGNAAKLSSMEVLDSIPDGSIIVNDPWKKDGKGDSRAKVYKRAGFNGPSDWAGQTAIKFGDKIYPLEVGGKDDGF